MNKNRENIELKIYEFLGIKAFRKMAFGLRDKLSILFTLKMSKEERKYYLYHTRSNYNLGKVNSLEDVKKFKKQLFLNTSIHVIGLLVCFPNFLKVITGVAELSTIIINQICICVNLYCIMLQRYNSIRINRLIEKMIPRYEKQKTQIKEELKNKDKQLGQHSYKIVNKKDKEISITIEQLLEKATIKELKQYREYLVYF